MSDFYENPCSGGSQFITDPSALGKRKKMRCTMTKSSYVDIQSLDDEINSNFMDDDELKPRIKKSQTLPIKSKQKVTLTRRGNVRKEKYFGKLLKTAKDKQDFKNFIENAQRKIDKLTEVVVSKVSENDDNLIKSTNADVKPVKEKQESKLQLKETKQALFLIAVLIIYTLAFIFLTNDNDSSTSPRKFSLAATKHKSLMDHFFDGF